MYWNITIVGILIVFNITLATIYRNAWLTLTSNCLFVMQLVLHIRMSPIKELLVSVNQSNSDNFIYFYYTFFDRAWEANIYAIKSRRLRRQILFFFCFSSFIFRDNHVFNEEDNLSQETAVIDEELNDIDTDDIGSLEDLSRLVFINEK